MRSTALFDMASKVLKHGGYLLVELLTRNGLKKSDVYRSVTLSGTAHLETRFDELLDI